ncbi:MAG: DNA starvation/stationary phase protection protein Dps [Candidatus Tectomicrobia bacterium RIFCSPLOWO2_12_FULL_69_37]|nr:MAG: DNA starvation/stationary phase protection protein Dps [Candidatus Tectomicrobia bacterium RIFCSPLOWO2_12_FULL_69_37]
MPTQTVKLLPTSHGLSPEARAEVIPMLQASLADALDLYTQLKQAHWNIKGPGFIALHKLFDEAAGEAEEWVDELAERIVELGGLARGTARAAAAESRLPAYPAGITAERDHLRAVVGALSAFAASARAAIDEAADACDAGTADLFTQISRGVDKHLWFVEAHLHG